MKIKKEQKQMKINKEILYYLFIIIASIIAAIPLIKLRIYGTHDGFIHLLRTLGVEEIFKQGIFPPYIDTKYCNGFGYAINVFYQPIVTYLPVLINVFTKYMPNALKIYSFITILISGFTMYALVKELSNKKEIALISSIIYIFIPYRLETIYTRFAIGEFSAYMFIPIVFLGLYNLLYGDRKKHYYISIGAIGLILTHTLTTEFVAIFSIIYLLLNIEKIKDKDVIKKIIVNIVFIILLTSFFTIPLLEYKMHSNYSIFSSDSMGGTPQYAASKSIVIKDMLFDNKDPRFSFYLGMPLILMTLISLFTYSKMKDKDKRNYLSFFVISILSFYMVTKYFPWIIMPKFMCMIQFPWRMLTLFEFGLSILCAYNVYTLMDFICTKKNDKNNTNNINNKNNKNNKNLLNILIYISVVFIVISMQKVNYPYKYEDFKETEDKQYVDSIIKAKKISSYNINKEYLPIEENIVKYIDERDEKIHILDRDKYKENNKDNIIIKNQNKDKLFFSAELENVKKDIKLELPFINYPGYKISLEYRDSNNQVIKKSIKYTQTENGFIEITMPETIEKVKIEVRYNGTLLERISYLISGISLILFIVYIIKFKGKKECER